MKKTWDGINDILHRRKTTKLITALKDPNNGNKIVKEPSQIPNILNEQFASVGNRLASTIPTSQQHYLNYVSPCKSPTSSFIFQPVSPDEVKLQILSIPNNKSYGLYSSPIKLLKCASSTIAPVLSEIFNASVTLAKYPSKLKLSKITPIFKNGEESDANNYRPISLLSNFNTIFEKIMYNRMKDYIDKHNLLYSSQYGFRKDHSMQHAILDIVSAIQSNINLGLGLFSCGVFIDLKKAFDTADHNILLGKLNHYGFRGSVLGPLLFLLYVNDIHQCSNKLKFYLFADDTSILYADKNLKSLENTVNFELHNLYNWLTSNKLTLNTSKTNFLIFHPYQKRDTYHPNLHMFNNEKNRNVTLESKNYIKYLGVLIDKNPLEISH